MAVVGYLFSSQLPSILLYADILPSNLRDVKCVNQAPSSAQQFPLPQFRQSTEKVRTVANSITGAVERKIENSQRRLSSLERY